MRLSCLASLLFLVVCASAYSRGSLPPVLEFLNGTRVTSLEQWDARRVEIFSLLQSTLYGTIPSVHPPLISSTILNTSNLRGYESSWVNLTWGTPLFPASATIEVIRPMHCTTTAPCPVSLVSKEHRRWVLVGALRGYVGVSTPCGDNSCNGDPTCTDVDPTRQWAQNYPEYTFQLIARRAYLSARILDFVCGLPYVMVRPQQLSAIDARSQARFYPSMPSLVTLSFPGRKHRYRRTLEERQGGVDRCCN
jgi:hypothetical protein